MDENQEAISLSAWRERFRERFAQLQAKGLTRKKLGDTLGVTQSTIGHWLSGRRAPDTLSMFSKLAAAVDMPTLQLLFGVEPAQVVTKEGAEVARAWEALPEAERVALKTAISLGMFSKLMAAVGMPTLQLLFGVESAQVVTKEGAEVARAWEALPEAERVALKTAILLLKEQLSKQDNL